MLQNYTILRSYLPLMNNIPYNMKDEFISSLKKTSSTENVELSKTFGAWKSEETAEEIIENIQNSRYFCRVIEEV